MTLQMSEPRGATRTPERVPFWAGVRTVAGLDLRQRLRTSRTRWVLLAWIVAVYGFVALTWFATQHASTQGQAALFYGVTIFVVLTLALLVAPSLSASAISGDRADGILASLQASLLSPAQIAVGKWLGAWIAALGFLAIAAPVLGWALLAGGVTAGSLGLAVLTLALVTGSICAIGIGVSALTARVVSSVAMTYVVLGFLAVGAPLLFGLTLPLTETTGPVRVLRNDMTNWQPSTSGTAAEPPPCVEQTMIRTVTHTERNWWLLTANPYVVVADAAPGRADPRTNTPNEPLGVIREGIRSARRGSQEPLVECWSRGLFGPDQTEAQAARGLDQPAWPYGFVTYAVLGAGSLAIAIRRLRTPVRRLARGTRIA